uniref:Uncharacterized protein n=1 Tax=Triticum urartu TaxID=4572 RepID=A0A8R7U266_TRIUA
VAAVLLLVVPAVAGGDAAHGRGVVVVHGGGHGGGVRHLRLAQAGRHRGGGEDVVGGGGPLVGEALHPLDVEAVLLEVAGDVLAGEALHVHQLHDGLGHRALDAQVRHHLHEPLVQLRRPHQPRPLRRRRLLPGRLRRVVVPVAAVVPGRRPLAGEGGEGAAVGVGAGAVAGGGRRGGGAEAGHGGGGRAVHVEKRTPRLRRDAERRGEPRRHQRLRERGQLVAPRQARLPLRDPPFIPSIAAAPSPEVKTVDAGLLPHGLDWIPNPIKNPENSTQPNRSSQPQSDESPDEQKAYPRHLRII